MRSKLKNASNLLRNKFCLFVFINFLFNSAVFSQKLDFTLDDKGFKITEDGKCVYNDTINLKSGTCSAIDVIKSDFPNQFYLYIENNCTSHIVKQLFKINFENKKFRIVNKEYISIVRNTFKSKNIYFENFVLDSINMDMLDIEEKFNTESSKNKTPIYFNNKIIAYKTISKDDITYNYPIIDNYQKMDGNINLYNDVAFILSKNKLFFESIYILEKVIEKCPTRVVAYLNIADCYWETNQKVKAFESYNKYISLMKSQKKDLKKIPKYVYDRVK